jgi:hypothetical protein
MRERNSSILVAIRNNGCFMALPLPALPLFSIEIDYSMMLQPLTVINS